MAIIASMERIHIQTDDFGKKLEGMITLITAEIDDSNKKNYNKHPLVETMAEYIHLRLGLKVKFMTASENIAAILPFYPNKNHIFLDPYFRKNGFSIKEQEKIIKELDGKRGWVNLVTARVGGFFSEYVNPVYMNFYQLYKTHGLTPGEITGILLHELGHGFNACYYADRTDETNQVLAAIFRRISSHKEADNVDYVYQEIKKLTSDVTKADVDGFINGSVVIQGTKLFKITTEVVKSQLLNDVYSRTAFEEGSDAFASRFGYGKDLAVGLSKISKDNPESGNSRHLIMSITTSIIYIVVFMLAISGILLAGAGVGALAIATLNIQLLCSLIFYGMTKALSDGGRDMTYDRLKQRYVRIRQEQIELIKDPDFPKQQMQDALDAIEVIDLQIERAKDFHALPGMIGNLIFRHGVNEMDIQKSLEKLASNDLFIHAATFKHA